MIERLQQAATEGLVLAVKWGIIIIGISVTMGMILADYSQTRAKATAAIEWIQQQQHAQQPPK